jgi:hypothetical protein
MANDGHASVSIITLRRFRILLWAPGHGSISIITLWWAQAEDTFKENSSLLVTTIVSQKVQGVTPHQEHTLIQKCSSNTRRALE